MINQSNALKQNLTVLIAQNKTAEANKTQQTLIEIEKKVEISVEGGQREAETPTSLIVHVFGALVGIAYLFLFKKKELKNGIVEFEELGDSLVKVIDSLQTKLAGPKKPPLKRKHK